jgi:hypothetical protein
MYLSKEKKEVGALSNTKYFHSGYYNHFVLSGINMIPLNARMLRRIPVTSIPLVVFVFFVLACCLVVANSILGVAQPYDAVCHLNCVYKF